MPEPERTQQYLRYKIYRGYLERYGPDFQTQERRERIDRELAVIEEAGFCSYFLILASITEFCREHNIVYGPGRGSVGGCYVAYLIGIHEIDSIEFDLIFERFLTKDRVGYPDVDLDFSQRDRDQVIQFIRDTYQRDGNLVLQVAAFARAGARSVIEHVCAAMRQIDPEADRTAYALRDCLPDSTNVTGGTKQARELAWWVKKGHGRKDDFKEIAKTAGWYDHMMKLDGMFTHLGRHAAGVVILPPEDLRYLPQTSADGENMMTGWDMYDLDRLGYLKIDALGLRTLDVIADAHKFIGGSGSTRDLMQLWRDHHDDRPPYAMLREADTLGIFQMETDGYRRTLRDFQPTTFNHIVHLNALYRPGALDYRREQDGRNMVEVFIRRLHHEEDADPPAKELRSILAETQGIFLYQEQAMRAVRELAGFNDNQADMLRKGIGKKKADIIDKLKPVYYAGCKERGIQDAVAERVWDNIEAAGRYSWNKAHAVEYAVITWLTLWFKFNHPAAFYGALLNSYDDKKDRMATAIAEARQRVELSPPDVNLAQGDFTVTGDTIVFGLNGVKGLGPANRDAIIEGRGVIPFGSFEDFCKRLPSLPMDKKSALIRAGAFDGISDRRWLLSTCDKPGKGQECPDCKDDYEQREACGCQRCNGSGRIPKRWTVATAINHNRNLKTPRPVPDDLEPPSDSVLSAGEVETVGFYLSMEPMANLSKAMSRLPRGNHFGGEIEKVYKKNDKNGNAMATLMLITPALTKQRVVVFASIWERYDWVEAGMQVVIRGKLDGESVLAAAIFEPGDVRHFKSIKASRNGGDPSVEKFDGQIETIEALEAVGYSVTLL